MEAGTFAATAVLCYVTTPSVLRQYLELFQMDDLLSIRFRGFGLQSTWLRRERNSVIPQQPLIAPSNLEVLFHGLKRTMG